MTDVVDPRLLESFRVFRREQEAADQADGFVPFEKMTERFGLVTSQVRLALVHPPMKAWAVPGRLGVIFAFRMPTDDGYHETVTLGGRAESVAKRGLFGWRKDQCYYGLMPDACVEVRLRLKSGASLLAQPSDNAFVFFTPEPAAVLEYTTGDGKQRERRAE